MLQTGICHPLDRRMRLQEAGNLLRIFIVPFNTYMQSLQPLNQLEGILWAEARPEVPQQLHADFRDEGKGSEIHSIADAVIACVGFGEFRELFGIPVEPSTIDDHTAY